MRAARIILSAGPFRTLPAGRHAGCLLSGELSIDLMPEDR